MLFVPHTRPPGQPPKFVFMNMPQPIAHDHGYELPTFALTSAHAGVPAPGGGVAPAQTWFPFIGGVVAVMLVPQLSVQKPCVAPIMIAAQVGALVGHMCVASHTLPSPSAGAFAASGAGASTNLFGASAVDLLPLLPQAATTRTRERSVRMPGQYC
jgi:hypothetical protein